MLKSIQTAIFVTVTISAFTANSVYASEWFDQQRSISDGYSAPNASAGVKGRQGFKPAGNPSWLDQQLAISDGYSPPNEVAARKSVYIGAKFESNSNDSFMERGRRIADGATE